ncbi:MAG: ribosome maturation factor RimP [Holosporaceae bacterium]|nr:ribosome maturation factor RimP [Holosporaceae bacterium]
MGLIEKITAAIEASLNHRGYEVVQVRILGGKRQIVEIDIDRFDNCPVTVEDCAKANHLISAILDVEDFIRGPYNLNVSSPGESRPLKKIEDFERFYGKDVKVELFNKILGRRRFCGRLLQVERNTDDSVVYLQEECDTGIGSVGVPYSGIKKATVKRF